MTTLGLLDEGSISRDLVGAMTVCIVDVSDHVPGQEEIVHALAAPAVEAVLQFAAADKRKVVYYFQE